MKLLTICLILSIISAQDTCREYQSFEKCVQSIGDQCRWNIQTTTCTKTSDYLFGCSPNLNKQACIKQLGTPSGTIAQCRFMQYCEYVPDFSNELCSNNLSKYACLGVTNINQRCIWTKYQCKVIDVKENVQSNFITSLYSASVCSLINNYFIVHSSILWKLQNYYPNLLVMAENQVKEDVGIQTPVNETYADPEKVKLANNYVDLNNNFLFYRFQTTKSSTSSNLKIADRKREGCIAVEIADDDDFQLLVSKQLPQIGYNHIYCRYLLQYNSYHIFLNGQCTLISYPKDLLDQNFIKNYQITCNMMGYQLCSVFNYDNKCTLFVPNEQKQEIEYSCVANQNPSQLQPFDNCPTNSFSASLCNNQKYCYVDTTTYKCTNLCQLQKTKSQCESNRCNWSDQFESFTEPMLEYQLCEPSLSCNQPGIDKTYCSQLGSTCSWNSITKQCYTVSDADLDILNCSDASNLMTCASIRRSDQLCFWSISTCYNVRDYTYLSSILSFSLKHIMNKNLCISQTDDNFEYQTNKTCQKVPDITQAKCSTSRIFNKQACYSITSQACYWNLNQQCQEFTNTSQLCSTLTNVNPIACQLSQQPMDSNKQCIYNQQNNSCIEVLKKDISCNLLGISKLICLSLIDKCQWINSRCQIIPQQTIDQYRCDLLIDVSSAVCQSYSRGFCQFEIYKGQYHCFSNSISQTNCDISYNGFVCQNSTAQCYFTNNVCTSLVDKPNLLTQLSCENNFLSKTACLAITTLNQPCFWDTRLSKCRLLQSSMTTCNQYNGLSNVASCSALETQINKILTKDAFCEFDSINKCTQNILPITDCGTILDINIHRCVAYTSSRCYFDQYRCWETTVGSLENIILNQIQCKQANQSLCNLVTTPQQFCIFINSAVGLQNDIKCTSSTQTNSNCTGMSEGGNPNYCSQAQNPCMFLAKNAAGNDKTKCQVPSTTSVPPSPFDCNNKNLGLSKTACVQMTKGVCMFLSSNQCIPFSYAVVEQINCSQLNQLACQTNTYLKCQWEPTNKICNIVQGDCPSQTRPDTTNSNTYASWALCSYSEGSDCIGNLNACSKTLPNPMPCDVIGTNKQSCLSDQANYVCEFYDGKCRYYQPRLCEGAISKQQCYTIITPGQFCVFQNQKCYNQINAIQCDIYQCKNFQLIFLDTNYNFCTQFPDCVWDKINFQCTNQQKYKELLQNLPNIPGGKACGDMSTSFECIFSISSSCKFDYATSKCVQVNPTDSILYQGDSYNIKSCVSQSYQYTLTKTGGFCSQQTVKCSDLLTKQLCTAHINDTLQCFWQTTCQSKLSTQLTCTDILGLPVNYPLCKTLQGNSCIYDLNNNKCKPSINPIINCSDPLVTSFVQCAYLVRASCVFSSDVCSASAGVFDANLNKFGCISLLNDFYYFDDVTWKCNLIANGDNLQGCENLNYDACIKITTLYYCRWNNGQCQEDNKMQTCTDLNYNNCLLLEKLSEICYWKNDQCNKAASDYPFLNEKRSLGYCSNKVIDGGYGLMNSNQDECEYSLAFNDLKLGFKYVQLPQCSGLGLNKLACQQNTLELACVWNDGCQDAILDQHLCVQAANKNTCLKLRTNQQFCQWKSDAGGSCILTTAPTSCATAFTLFSCQSVMQEQCQWDIQNLICKSISSFNSCDSTLSKLACTQVFSSVSSQQCTFTNNQCQKYEGDPTVCSQIADFQTCMNFTKILIFCQWVNNKCTLFPRIVKQLLCPLIPQGVNQNVCKTFSEDLCFFNSKSNTCSNKFNADYFGQNTNLDQFNQKLSVPYLQQFQSRLYSEKCESLSAQECTQSRVKSQYCQLSSNVCITITNLNVPCNNLNIYACINSTQNGCFWKQDQCNTFGNMITLTELTNVNSIVCSTQTTSSIPHLYFQNSCYATSDLSKAKCTDQGIDRVTCLQLNQPCTFVGNKCQNFVKTNQANCSDYQSVTLSVCQQIQDLACQKKEDNCDNFVQVAGMKIDSLSKLACLRYTEFAVYWNGSCQFLSTPLQCGSNTLVNALSCVKIETNRTPCIYDSVNFVCTPNFNKYSIKCTTPGLNVFGCAQVQTQACVFKNKCQEYTLTDQQCQNIKNVNSLACQIQLTDSCYYDESMLQCSPSPNQPLCSLSGLNLAACGTNSICSWNNYLTKCQCNSEIQSNECSALVVTSCTGLCSYINGQCVQSTCESQPISNCSGTLRGLKCYISNSQCFSASTCYDMYNTQCSNYGCDQAGNQCVPQGSSQVCQYLKDCNNIKCKFQQGICRPLQCSDLSQEQCYQSDDCYFSNNLCQDLLGCQQLSNDADQCNQKQCNYQKYNIMSQQLYCTAQYCDVYGASNNICNGNEMNFQACLLNGLKCQTCESITDVCLCQQAKNICLYSDNKCKSILCQGMDQSLCDSTVNRCYWSNKLNICAKKCEKIIDQSDCELRGSECYFNENTKLCYTAIITIPDVTNINDTTVSFGTMLATLYFLF